MSQYLVSLASLFSGVVPAAFASARAFAASARAFLRAAFSSASSSSDSNDDVVDAEFEEVA